MPRARIKADGKPTAIAAGMTLDAARRAAAALLEPVSAEEAHLDARILLEHATGLGSTKLLLDGDALIGEVSAERLREALRRRLAREPVWRILGRREFWGLPFAITPDVLDPRPDTETLVAAALDAVSDRRRTGLRLLDLGVGSGAILCALLSELGEARGWGVDRSEAACRIARANSRSLGMADRSLMSVGDWGEAFAADSFDLIVSNPPYIETSAIDHLAAEVRDHDPLPALDGGADGLACYRDIAAGVPRLLASGAVVAVEVGQGQAPAVADLFAAQGLAVLRIWADLGGIERAIVAKKTVPTAA